MKETIIWTILGIVSVVYILWTTETLCIMGLTCWGI